MIRAYKESDFSDIEKIYNSSKADEFSGEKFNVNVTPLNEDQQMLDLFRTSKIYVYDDNGVIGFSGIKENYLSWLFVRHESRGKKVGKKLAEHMISKAEGEVTLNVARSNIVAISLYKTLGFKVTREFVDEYQGKPIHVWKMSNVTETISTPYDHNKKWE